MEEKMVNPLVSVYTCVYNRADKIHRVFESMKAQTYKNIEHIIVDDGSTDGVLSLIEEYRKEVDFPVTVVHKQNGGKHTATNVAWDRCKGDYLVQLDSDDMLTADAIEYLVSLLNKVPEEKHNEYWCYLARCRTQFSQQMIGQPFPPDINNLSREEALKLASKIDGEKIGLLNFLLLKEVRFPEPCGVKFIPEGVVWSKMDEKYKTYYSNKVIRKYFVNEGPNLSHQKFSRQMLTNKVWSCRWQIENKQGSFFSRLKCFVAYSAAYFFTLKEYRKNNRYFFF